MARQLRRGRVLEVGENMRGSGLAGSTGLSIDGTRVRFLGDTLRIPVAEEMLGRVFDGLGNPLDGGPQPLTDHYADVNGQPIIPTARIYPRDYIQTGISAIDGLNTLLRGQKLPIFSGAGMPHDQLAAQIVRQATLGAPTDAPASEAEQFAIVFAAMGVKHDVANFFRRSFTDSGALTRVCSLIWRMTPVERLLTPRGAYLQSILLMNGMHVLVVLTDMTNYCEAFVRSQIFVVRFQAVKVTRVIYIVTLPPCMNEPGVFAQVKAPLPRSRF